MLSISFCQYPCLLVLLNCLYQRNSSGVTELLHINPQCQLVKRSERLQGVVCRERAARVRFQTQRNPAPARRKAQRTLSPLKTSLSAGGFLRVPYGFGIGLWLHTRQAIIKISNNMAHHGYSIRIIFCFFPNLVEKIVIIV